MPKREGRDFAGKVHAFNAGYARVSDLDYDIIGNLDADITFDEEYFDFLLRKFAEKPRLGVAGTPFQDESMQYDYRIVSTQHVSGACQLFRRECFEEIGGYMPSKAGGVDLLAVTSGTNERVAIPKRFLRRLAFTIARWVRPSTVRSVVPLMEAELIISSDVIPSGSAVVPSIEWVRAGRSC